MDQFRAEINSCGPGGIHCNCCKPKRARNKKERWWTRLVRRALKQKDRREYDRAN